MFSIRFAAFIVLSLLPISVFAQGGGSQVQMGKVSTDKYLKMEEQVRAGLPELLSDLQDMGNQIKKGQWEESKSKLDELRSDLHAANKALSKEPPYQEVQNTFDKMQTALDKASDAVERKDRKTANLQIAQAYRYAKVLAESPALKLSTAMALVDGAGNQIRAGNYQMAGNFLNRSLDILSQIENNSKIDMRDVNALKNEIVVVHQQVVLGKLEDAKPVMSIYNKMAIANTNTLYQYYDMWSRSDLPWDNY